MARNDFNSNLKVLAFDVFGTVVDWHGSVMREVSELNLNVEPAEFARRWRAGYAPAMARVASGELNWMKLDDLHEIILREVLEEFKIDSLSEAKIQHLNRCWHRLTPWPDSAEGLSLLKQDYIICTLSNGNIGLLTNMAKAGHLPWDCILSSEVFRHYKPHPQTYLGVARVFDVAPSEVMLVAAHNNDLAAARSCGLKTAYVERRFEFGVDQEKDVSPCEKNDVHAIDFIELANILTKSN